MREAKAGRSRDVCKMDGKRRDFGRRSRCSGLGFGGRWGSVAGEEEQKEEEQAGCLRSIRMPALRTTGVHGSAGVRCCLRHAKGDKGR